MCRRNGPRHITRAVSRHRHQGEREDLLCAYTVLAEGLAERSGLAPVLPHPDFAGSDAVVDLEDGRVPVAGRSVAMGISAT